MPTSRTFEFDGHQRVKKVNYLVMIHDFVGGALSNDLASYVPSRLSLAFLTFDALDTRNVVR